MAIDLFLLQIDLERAIQILESCGAVFLYILE